MAQHSYIHGVPESRQVQGGVSVGKCRSDRGFKLDIKSSINTTTATNVSIANDDMTTTDNDDDDKARRATHAGHALDLCLSPGGGVIQEAGTTPSGVSVPAGSLITVQSCEESANSVLPGQPTMVGNPSVSEWAEP